MVKVGLPPAFINHNKCTLLKMFCKKKLKYLFNVLSEGADAMEAIEVM